jgi:hypothetical protein
VYTKLVIQSDKCALQEVEDALTRAQEAYDASVIEAGKLHANEIAAISEVHGDQVQQMTVSREQEIATLKEQRSEIKKRLARRRAFIAPVKWLPSELLSEIFIIQVDCGDSPWTLLRVCRLWKVVATSTPRIWRYINMSRNHEKFDSETSWQSCYMKVDIEKALSRTGAAPLVIKIDIDLKSWFQSHAEESCLFPIFDTLAKSLNRCDTLRLEGGHGDSDKDEAPWVLATLQFPLSSSLRCLYVEVGWESIGITQRLLVACNHESTALRELSIVDRSPHYYTRGDALIRLLANHQFLLERLTSFSAKYVKFPEDITAAMHRLSYFSFENRYSVIHQLCSISDQLQEVHLRSVLLQLSTRQFEIKLPVLDTLIFENVTWLPVLMLDCPSLLHLELAWECSPFKRYSTWKYTRTDAESEVNQLWNLKQRFAYLKTLKIDLGMSDTALITILQKSVALELLVITIWSEVQAKSAPGEVLFSDSLLEHFGRSGFVPSLRTLILRLQYDTQDSTAFDDVSPGLWTGMQRVVRSRQRSAPLWRASIEVLEWDFFPELSLEVVEKEEFVVCEEEQ